MLDPLSALGLAASVVQFVDFASKLLSEGHEIYRSGSNKETVILEDTVTHLITINNNFRALLRPHPLVLGCLDRDEQELENLAGRCSEAADELIGALKALGPLPGSSKWKIPQQALRSVWNKKKIDEMKRRLHGYRDLVQFEILVSLQKNGQLQITNNAERFDDIEASHQGIQDKLWETHDTVLDLHERVIDVQESNEQLAQSRHEETITAIRAVRYDAVSPNEQQNRHMDGQTLQKSILASSEDIHTRVLEGLYFRQMTDRQEDVKEAHEHTFQWVFSHPQTQEKPWSNFAEWLRSQSGIYWISGKAGSGKSTLMKYITEDIRTQKALEAWAGTTRLVTARHFFWRVGTSLQKSQVGLLRSLLYDLLKSQPWLTPLAFPEMYQSVGLIAMDLMEPSLAELRKAFTRVSTQEVSPVRICFFIDGIDEYDGDHSELANLLASISSPWVKILLSSRAIPACVMAFSGYPKLQLQDLTQTDIETYAEAKLNSRMGNLLKDDPERASLLFSQIVDKASGVFLWVRIVVQSLIDGIEGFDDVTDLQNRIDELPADLQALYEYMLGEMTPLYRKQGSQLLQIVKYAHETISSTKHPISTLQLSFAQENDPKYALEANVCPLTPQERLARCQAMEERLRRRCCGLIEVQRSWDDTIPMEVTSNTNNCSREEFALITSRVTFLHKTVMDFLLEPEIWTRLTAFTVNTSFSVEDSLMRAYLLETKTYHTIKPLPLHISLTWAAMSMCLTYCRLTEVCNGQASTPVLQELDRTMSVHWYRERTSSVKEAMEDSAGFCASEEDWTLPLLPERVKSDQKYDNLVMLATSRGLALHLEHSLEKGASGSVARLGASMAMLALESFKSNDLVLASTSVKILDWLLLHGLNPNIRSPEWDHDVWEGAMVFMASVPSNLHSNLHLRFHYIDTIFTYTSLWCRTLELLILHGAGRNCPRPGAARDRSLTIWNNFTSFIFRQSSDDSQQTKAFVNSKRNFLLLLLTLLDGNVGDARRASWKQDPLLPEDQKRLDEISHERFGVDAAGVLPSVETPKKLIRIDSGMDGLEVVITPRSDDRPSLLSNDRPMSQPSGRPKSQPNDRPKSQPNSRPKSQSQKDAFTLKDVMSLMGRLQAYHRSSR